MANVDIREGYKDAAWFTANPTLVLKQGQRVNLLQTGTYKLGDGTTQLSALQFLGGGDTVDVNTIGAAINGAASATPNDTDLVMSVDTSVAKKNTWTQIKSFLKTYFDTLFVKKGTITNNTILKGSGTDTATDSSITDDGTTVTILTNEYQILSDNTTYQSEINGYSDNLGSEVNIGILSPSGYSGINISNVNTQIYRNDTNPIILSASNVRVDNLTPSQIVATDASKNLQSLDVATYPDLTELSYVKGATSALQTQLNNKSVSGSVLLNANSVFSPADATTYYIGGIAVASPTITPAARRMYIGNAVTVISASFTLLVTSILGTSEDTTVYIRVNNTTDYTIGTIKMNSATQQVVINTSLNISLASTDYFEIKIVTPTWVTKPKNVCFAACVNYK